MNSKLQIYQEFSAVVRLVPLRKKKGGIRPIGIGEPFSKVEGHLWADEIDDSAQKVLRPFQFGYRCPAGGEACVRSFQFENDSWPMQLGEVDGINFFGEMKRMAMVDGAALISPEYEQYTAGRLAQPTTYYYYDANGVRKLLTLVGCIQGAILSTVNTSLAMVPAQRKFANTVQFKYPGEKVIGAATHIASSMVQEEHLALLPAPAVVLQSCPRPASAEESPSTLVFCSLRAYVDNQTLRCPAALFSPAKTILEQLMAPLGVKFHASPAVWDSAADPDGGLITLGIPLWAGSPSRDASADEPNLLHAVGSDAFIIQHCLTKLEHNYLDALDKLRDVIRAAPSGRDVRSSVERTLRICIIPKLTSFARAFPPSLIKSTL